MQNIIDGQTAANAGGISGFLKAHRNRGRTTRNPHVITRVETPIVGKVALVTAGRAAEGPGYVGFLGPRMLDAVALGDVPAAASPTSLFDAFQEVDAGAGVACLLANNAEETASAAFATLLASREGIEVATVVARDDVGSAPPERPQDRRGGAGVALMWKVAGALASLGADLAEVQAVAQRAVDGCRTISFALDIPLAADAEAAGFFAAMEIGVGLHGEAGVEIVALQSATGLARRMLNRVLGDRPRGMRCNDIAVLLTGLGHTSIGDLYTIYDAVADEAGRRGQRIHCAYVGNYFTSVGTAGVSLSVMRLDEELKGLLDMGADCASIR
jgi:dihydroxyacetone kinase-like protein